MQDPKDNRRNKGAAQLAIIQLHMQALELREGDTIRFIQYLDLLRGDYSVLMNVVMTRPGDYVVELYSEVPDALNDFIKVAKRIAVKYQVKTGAIEEEGKEVVESAGTSETSHDHASDKTTDTRPEVGRTLLSANVPRVVVDLRAKIEPRHRKAIKPVGALGAVLAIPFLILGLVVPGGGMLLALGFLAPLNALIYLSFELVRSSRDNREYQLKAQLVEEYPQFFAAVAEQTERAMASGRA